MIRYILFQLPCRFPPRFFQYLRDENLEFAICYEKNVSETSKSDRGSESTFAEGRSLGDVKVFKVYYKS